MMRTMLARFALMSGRERFLIGAALVLICGALLWSFAIAPALRKIESAQNKAPILQAQLQNMRMQAQEIAMLKGQKQLTREESRKALDAAMPSLGVGASLNAQDNRITVNLKNAAGDALVAWLTQVRVNARLIPSEVHLKTSSVATTPTTTAAWDGSIIFNLDSP